MIDKDKNPVEWAGLMYQLEDAHEHLGKLISEMMNDPEFDEEIFKIQLGHVCAHLNRAWYSRHANRYITEETWITASQFPDDLDPIG
ncbi:MAG: hypothetical protein K2P84_01160 [Undibacterium sp.]|nr:hypothetical protein [Undibacterium sp.]